jgi:hypothetical protein
MVTGHLTVVQRMLHHQRGQPWPPHLPRLASFGVASVEGFANTNISVLKTSCRQRKPHRTRLTIGRTRAKRRAFFRRGRLRCFHGP